MNNSLMGPFGGQKLTVLLITLAITALFLVLIWDFLIALFLAAVFSGLAYPFYKKILDRMPTHKGGAASLTLLLLTLVVLLPGLGMLNLIAIQAYELSQEVVPWIEQRMENPEELSLSLPSWVPFHGQIENSGPQVAAKLGELAGKTGGYLVSGLSAATKGTANFFLELFVMVYAMFYFLRHAPDIVNKIVDYMPLSADIQNRLVDKGLSVTRATIKGTLVIGLVQGVLGGLAFAVAGIQGAAFWGAVMALASVIPSVGTALIWVPAVIYLLATGQLWEGVGLGLWCALVVGSADNVLRPILVGGDTEMPDILILISTFGGLALFGIEGLVLGPVIAALFVTMWDIYYETFRGTATITEEGRGAEEG